MLKYLIYTKGQLNWHSWGGWTETLATVKKHMNIGMERGLTSDNILALESKSPCECVYRIKKLIDGKWHNSAYIDVYQDHYAEAIYKYTEAHIDEYIKFRDHEREEYGETYSMLEWATRNDMAIRTLILWLYDNDYIFIS